MRAQGRDARALGLLDARKAHLAFLVETLTAPDHQREDPPPASRPTSPEEFATQETALVTAMASAQIRDAREGPQEPRAGDV